VASLNHIVGTVSHLRPPAALGLLLLAGLCYSCGDPTVDAGLTPPVINPPVTALMAIRPISGSGQAASVGASLPAPIVIRAYDSVGNPFPGVPIAWAANRGGTLPLTENVTDATGTARAQWVLGDTAGAQAASATSSVGVVNFAAQAQAILDSLVISPGFAAMLPGNIQLFQATPYFTGGAGTANVTFSATGGVIGSDGRYVAGSNPGVFQVIAQTAGGVRADTAVVTISLVGATLQSLTLSPGQATVLTGATQNFTVSGVMSDGTVTVPVVTYSASGGTITAGGQYRAGSTAGKYRVTATSLNGQLTDTSTVTVVAQSSGPGAIFYADWGTAIGTTTDALTDGGRWDDAAGPHNNIAVVDAAVAPGAPSAHAYRVTNSVSDLGYNWVEKANLWLSPQVGETRYWRVYLFNSTANSQGTLGPEASYHPLEFASPVYNGMEQFNLIFSTNSNGTFPFKFAPLGASFPKSRWIPTSASGVQAYPKKFTWYRVEWSLTKTATNVFTMHARISERNPTTGVETVVWDDDNIRDASLNLSIGASGTGITGINDQAVGQLRVGTNGGSVWFGLTSDQYIYWAGMCVRSDTWCGPYVAGEH
jgi:hypothetical protein